MIVCRIVNGSNFEIFVFFILPKNSSYLSVMVAITAFVCASKLDYTCDLISVHNLCDQTFCLQMSSQQPDYEGG